MTAERQIEVRRYFPAEFITLDPKRLDARTLVVLGSKSGTTPEGDFISKGMSDVVDGTSKLADADRHAIAVYIQSLPALPETPK